MDGITTVQREALATTGASFSGNDMTAGTPIKTRLEASWCFVFGFARAFGAGADGLEQNPLRATKPANINSPIVRRQLRTGSRWLA